MTLQGKDLLIIDVRTSAEFNRGHIPTALNLHGASLRSHLSELPPTTTVAIVCQSGGRSQLACEGLRREFKGLSNVDGGTAAWIRAGLPVEKENKNMQQTSDSKLRLYRRVQSGEILQVLEAHFLYLLD